MAEAIKSNQSTDGLTRFVIKLRAKPAGWLYVTDICRSENGKVTKFQYGPSKDRAQRFGKLTAEAFAESMKQWGRRQLFPVVEPEIFEAEVASDLGHLIHARDCVCIFCRNTEVAS